MKKKTIAASIMTLALCGSLAVGGTFALFTSEKDINVSINAGNVEMLAEIKNVTLYSPTEIYGDGTIKNEANAATSEAFYNGGTASVTGNTLTIERMTPGDSVSFDIVLENKSDVNIIYQTIISSVEDNGLFDGLKVTYEGEVLEAYAGFNMMSQWKALEANAQPNETDATISISVELPATAGGEYKRTSTKLAFNVTALQGNTYYENPIVSKEVESALAANDENIVINLGNPVTKISISDIATWGGENTKTITINGNGNTLVLDNGDESYHWAVVGAVNTDAKLIFNNVNVKTTVNIGGTWDSHNINFRNETEMTNVNFEQEIAMAATNKTMTLNKVSIVPTAGQDLYAIWVEAGSNLVANDCYINASRGIKVDDEYVEKVSPSAVSVSNTKFVTSGSKAAIMVNSVAEVSITVDTIDITEVKADPYYGVWVQTDMNLVTVDGTPVRGENDYSAIASAAQLVAFANYVNAGNNFAGETVTLIENINMQGVEWTPISKFVAGNKGNYFNGTFNGNDKTISNLTVNETVGAGLFGDLRGTVTNLTMDKATVTGNHYAGVIAAYCSDGCSLDINSCTVTNSTVTLTAESTGTAYDNGDKAGGIMGYSASGSITNCTVKDTTVGGYRDVGGIIGYAACVVTGNTVENVTLVCDKTHNYENYETDAEYDVNDVVGHIGSKATVSGNTVNGVTESVAVGTVEEFVTALEKALDATGTGDYVVNLTQNFDMAKAWTTVDYTSYNYANLTINGNGYTIYNLNQPLIVGNFGSIGTLTINDLTIADAKITSAQYNGMGLGAFVCYSDASGAVTLNNCHLVNSTVECTNGYAGGLIGYSSSVTTVTDCSVTGSTISGQKSAGAIIGHGAANVTVTNCTVSGNMITETLAGRTAAGAAAIAGRMNSGCTLTLTGTITITDNTINQGAVAGAATSICCANADAVTTDATIVTD